MKRRKILSCALAAAIALGSMAPVWAASGQDNVVTNGKTVKNIIMMIPDGMSVTDTTLARWYQDGKPLNLDALACGLVRTHSADAPIADSAPAGTAFATGYKSHTGFVGVLPDERTMPGETPIAKEDQRRPVASILEALQLKGKATGVIATSEIMHATPADFTAHDPSRKNYDNLSEQQVYQGLDVVLGSGSKFFEAANRGDKEDLVSEIKSTYQYVTTLDEMNKVKSGKLWGMFAPADMAYEFDRPANEPSLAEMTTKAIELLKNDPDGFFLVVEGSKVDWASHANDPIGVISDVLAYDKAVGAALDFAKKDGNTAVISVTDHGNGGMTIGSKATDNDYDKRKLSEFIDPLKKATLTGEGVEKRLNADRSNAVEIMAKYFGVSDLTAEEIKAIKETEAGSMNYTVGPILSKRSNIGWTTNGHTGEDVVLYIYAPDGVSKLTGVVDNTDIAFYMAKLTGTSLKEATDKLFVSAGPAFKAKGAQVSFTDSGNKNYVITAVKGNTEVKIPINKDYALVNGEKVQLSGVSVYNGISSFVPQDAVELMK